MTKKTVTLSVSRAREVKRIPIDSLLIDVDKAKFSLKEIFIILRLLHIRPRFIRCDRTRHGWHLIIPAKGLNPVERIAIQAILGSDPRREALNLFRLRNGVNLNLLFEPKKH